MTDKFWGTAEVAKVNKRLCIRVLETDAILYVPPDHVRVPNRDALRPLALAFTQLQRRDIKSITIFESTYTKRVLQKDA